MNYISLDDRKVFMYINTHRHKHTHIHLETLTHLDIYPGIHMHVSIHRYSYTHERKHTAVRASTFIYIQCPYVGVKSVSQKYTAMTLSPSRLISFLQIASLLHFL